MRNIPFPFIFHCWYSEIGFELGAYEQIGYPEGCVKSIIDMGTAYNAQQRYTPV